MHAQILPHPSRGPTGGDAGDLKGIRVLNRVLRWLLGGSPTKQTPDMSRCSSRTFPRPQGWSRRLVSRTTRAWKPTSLWRELKSEDSGGGAARANYLAQDRADICYATKELCRRMHAPCKRDIVALERLVKYLASEPRLVLEYEWQATANLQVYCDTDFAGCQVTRKSTS